MRKFMFTCTALSFMGLALSFVSVKPKVARVSTADASAAIVQHVASAAVPFSAGADRTAPAAAGCPNGRHPHLIDLGLPGGTKWACCNVGASKPEDCGGYFAWGETSEKSEYSSDTYTVKVNSPTDISGTQRDVAHVKWGGAWRMPTRAQFKELLEHATSKWVEQNGVEGRRFTGKNGASIFLPATGFRLNDKLSDVGTNASYWSATYDEGVRFSDPFYLLFDVFGALCVNQNGRTGFAVRAVCRN